MIRAILSLYAIVLAVAGIYPATAAPNAAPNSVQSEFAAAIADTKSSMMANPQRALSKAKYAETLARSMTRKTSSIDIITSQWLQGEALTRLNRPEEALPINTAALSLIAIKQPKSKLHADLVKSSAVISAKSGHVQEALPKLHRAFAMYQKLGDTRSQAIILQNLGGIYNDGRDYARALHYFEQAKAVHKDDLSLNVALYNNRGNAFRLMGKITEAGIEYRAAMNVAKKMDSPFLQMQILTNIALIERLEGKTQQAKQSVATGIKNSIGDAAEWRLYFTGIGAQIALDKGDLVTAKKYADQTFAGVDLKSSATAMRDLHETAYKIYQRLGQNELALTHLEAFKRLDDDGRELAASTNNALIGAQFDIAAQRTRIAKLESQKVQRELILARSETRIRGLTQYAVIGSVAALSIIIAMLFAVAASRRRRREVSAANVQLTHAANHDLLTGLANRFQFRRLLEEGLHEAAQDNERCALLLIDLDRFKWVNDTMGHNAGDELLCLIAGSLRVIAGDHAHAVRLGGDEFAIVVPGAPDDDALYVLADDIIARVSIPHDIEGTNVTVGATIGIAVGPADGDCVKDLTRNADLALYNGKAAGRNRAVRFERSMEDIVDERRALEKDLREALEKGQLSLAYQSIVDARTEVIVGYEALLRWKHPVRGNISPAIFVPIAEEAGLINEIGNWVLHTACIDAKKWPDHMRVAVNLSSLQVEGQGLVANLINALASSGLPPSRLELEVTESVFLREENKTDETLARIRAVGVSLVLDDFGTGYSSLGYLRRASFSTIKIDRGFVQSASTGSKDSLAIIRAIVSMARDLGMKTTAEGIETKAEVSLMRDLGCTQLQGYLFSLPSSSPSESTSDVWFGQMSQTTKVTRLPERKKRSAAG
jgi:diguanylate cyclase (GGDEF)-like protein